MGGKSKHVSKSALSAPSGLKVADLRSHIFASREPTVTSDGEQGSGMWRVRVTVMGRVVGESTNINFGVALAAATTRAMAAWFSLHEGLGTNCDEARAP